MISSTLTLLNLYKPLIESVIYFRSESSPTLNFDIFHEFWNVSPPTSPRNPIENVGNNDNANEEPTASTMPEIVFKIRVTNLRPNTSGFELRRLFTEAERITMFPPSSAEIMYFRRQHAETAVEEYHNFRLNDGRQIQCTRLYEE